MRSVATVVGMVLVFAATMLVAAGDSAVAADAGFGIRASSIHSGAYQPEYALDRNPQTRWASASFNGSPQWLQVDLGTATPVENLAISWETAHAVEYQIQLSNDGKTWQTVHHQTSGKGGKELISGISARGRYLRVLCLKPASHKLFSIWEIEFPNGKVAQAIAESQRKAAEAREKAEIEARRALSEKLADYDVDEIIFALRQPGKDGHWYANFSYWSHDETAPLYGNGGLLCRLNVATGEKIILLKDAEGAVRDPVVHYDAKKILFSYRPGGTENYHLWEINVDGSGLKQLTGGPHDDIEPAYLPDGDIVFVSSRCNRWVQCWLTKVAVLHRCGGGGENIRPISANPEHDNTPWPLPDGRILYQRWEYVDRSQVDYHHLWTANPDGTGQMVYYGNMYPGTVMIDAKPIPETNKIVAIFSPGHGRREHDGNITVVDPRKGPDERSFARPVAGGGSCRDPWAFSEELFMAAKSTQIVLLDNHGNTHELYRLSDEERAAGLQCHEPRPLIVRNRERLIPDRVDPRHETGTLVLADIYDSRNMPGVKRGDIKKLLVIEALPKPVNFTGGMDPLSYGGSFTLERVVGTVPVEPDGSAHMKLPALRALFFVALDENDLAVKRMQSFLTVQPGEVTSCVGCHEHRTETFLPSANLMAMNRRPSPIEPIADCPDIFDFPRDIQPILDKLCVGCHGYEKSKLGGPYAGGVSLTGDRGPMFSHAYFTMTVRRLFSDGRNLAKSNYAPRSLGSGASRILTMLDGSHYGAKGSEHDRKMLRLWIEAAATYPGTYAALGCGSIGGYQQNRLINTDSNWPTTKAGAEVIQRRCASCHQKAKILPRSMSDERGLSFWRFNMDDPRLRLSRHIVFNLTRPEKSLLLLAPLSSKSGGLELCRDTADKPAVVFTGTDDPDYTTLLAMVAAGRENLETIKRFDMPGFKPRPQYVREMRRYGVLPADHPDDAEIDVYETDRKYWESLWHRAPTSRTP